MDILICSAGCLLANIAATIMRYMPFSGTITKKQNRKLALAYLAALSFFYILNIWLGFTFNLNLTFYKQIFLLYDLVLMGINMLIIRKYVREHLFVCGLAEVILLAIFTIVNYLCNFIQTQNVTRVYAFSALMMIAVFLLLCPFIKKFLENTITPFIESALHKKWNTLWAIPYIMFYASYIVVPYDTYDATLAGLINRILVTVATLFICRSVAEDYKHIENQRAVETQLSIQQEHYKALSDNVAMARKARHDFKHHITAITNLCESDDREALKEYCNSLIESSNVKIAIPYTGNAAADGILYHYALIAEENGIRFSVSGSLESEGIADIDLCVMLGNALDNAMTATMKLESDRFVSVQSNVSGNVLAVTVKNSYDGVVVEKKGKIMSTKRENRVGVGLLSIKSVCQKYGGDMQVNHDENTFSVMMLLNKSTAM